MWWIKTAQGWKYAGQGQQAGQKKFTRKPVVKKTPDRVPKEKQIFTKSFKDWFGDWENDPKHASKVVDKQGEPEEQTGNVTMHRGKPVPVFHGTAVGGIIEFKKRYIERYSIYGKGFYFTADKSIADEYATVKDAEPKDLRERAQGIISKAGNKLEYIPKAVGDKILVKIKDKTYANPNWDQHMGWALIQSRRDDGNYDADKFFETARESEYRRELNGDPHSIFSGGKPAPMDISTINLGLGNFFGYMAKEGFSVKPYNAPPEVVEVYLNVKKPFEMENVMSKAEVTTLLGQMTKQGFSPYMDDLLPGKTWDTLDFDYGDSMKEWTYEKLMILKKIMQESRHEKDYSNPTYGIDIKAGELVFPLFQKTKPDEITGAEVQYIMTNAQKDAEGFAGILKAEGYDGITHEGGWNIGVKPHTVWIAFEPIQIKSTDNEGSYDPENPNIRKSVMMVMKSKASEQLDVGIKIEMEHTNDPKKAKKIALEHLDDDPEYYSHLLEMIDKYHKAMDDDDEEDEDEEEQSERELEYEKERAAEERKENRAPKAKPHMKSMLVMKAKPYPEGTIRKHGGVTKKKVGKKWVIVKKGKKAKVENGQKINGTKEMFTALKNLSGGEHLFLDDLQGAEKKLYNSLTKDGLVKWRHVGSDMYKAELTDAGKKAADQGEGLTSRKKRETTEEQRKLVDSMSRWIAGVRADLRPIRGYIQQLDGTLDKGGLTVAKQDIIQSQGKQIAEPLLNAVKKLPATTLIRSSDNPAWKEVKEGDRIPFGMGSFSKNDVQWAAQWGGDEAVILKHTGKLSGIDIEAELRDVDNTDEWKRAKVDINYYKREKEILVRAKELRVKSIKQKKVNFEMQDGDIRTWTMTVVEVESVGMEKSEDQGKLCRKLSSDFDKPMRSKKKKGKVKEDKA